MTGNNDHDIDELLDELHEAELKYRKYLAEVENNESLGVKPGLKIKIELVERECEYKHLKRRFAVEFERMKIREE